MEKSLADLQAMPGRCVRGDRPRVPGCGRAHERERLDVARWRRGVGVLTVDTAKMVDAEQAAGA